MNYFASIDQGTTSSRFIVFDESGDVDENYLAAKLKDRVSNWVKAHEEKASVEDF